MTAKELKKKYLDFFKKKEHVVIPSASLIPEHDSSVLFTTAGMHPLVPYLLGQEHPAGKRLVNVQKSFRTDDIDEVGDAWHNTFFEMLGNWSLGDYWKKEAISWSIEFLTKELKVDPKRIYVTVFGGDPEIPGVGADEETIEIWKKLGIAENKIFRLGKADNWWGPVGRTGPCGPDTEMFYDTGLPKHGENCKPGDNCGKYAEIWNDVFMQYNQIQRTLLVDGMFCLYDKGFEINEELLNILKFFNARKILVVDGYAEKAGQILDGHGFEIFSLEKEKITKESSEFFARLLEEYNLSPEETIYFDHKEENVASAKKLGIVSDLYSDNKEAKKFIEVNVYDYEELKQKNVDTGMGVERTAAVLQGKDNAYDTELFTPVIEKIKKLAGSWELRSARIIADHIRAATFLIADGVLPSNVERGYVLRRLIRRAIRFGRLINIKEDFTKEIAEEVIRINRDDWPEVGQNSDKILGELSREEAKFRATLEVGIKQFEKLGEKISGTAAFDLYQSYGFPLELTVELAKEKGKTVDAEGFNKEFEKHQEISRAGAGQRFAGGLVDHTEKTTRGHTATHLLHQALREVLGENVHQTGSNITPERIRFDFSQPDKLTEEQIKKVEELINQKIKEDLPVKREVMSVEEAKKADAIGLFEEKYGEKVSVYSIGDFSKEICGGPHVEHTSQIGKFKIIKEEALGTGQRRIRAVLE